MVKRFPLKKILACDYDGSLIAELQVLSRHSNECEDDEAVFSQDGYDVVCTDYEDHIRCRSEREYDAKQVERNIDCWRNGFVEVVFTEWDCRENG